MPRDETHFWDFVVFLVEDTFFRVPKIKFSQSSGIFTTTFSLPQTTEAEGSSEENPFRLKGVKKVDFSRFLTGLYPVEGVTLDTDGWISVLKHSTMWDFHDLRELAIKELTPLIPPVERILHGRKYDVHRWVCSGYWQLCTRKETISEVEAKQVGYQTAFRLELVREQAAVMKISQSLPWSDEPHKYDYAGTIRRVFEDEFIGVDVDEKWFMGAVKGKKHRILQD